MSKAHGLRFLVIILALAGAFQCHAAALSNTQGWFASKGVSARAMGMGQAFTAVSDDVNAIYWNPAGLATNGGTEFSSMHTDLYDLGIMQNSLSFRRGNLGILWEGTDYQQLAGFICKEDTLVISFSRDLPTNTPLYVGANIKGLFANVDSTDGSSKVRGLGVDLGLMAQLNYKTTLGLLLRDPISLTKGNATLGDEQLINKEKLAPQINLGIALKNAKKSVTAFEIADLTGKATLHLGTEYRINNSVVIRGGLSSQGLSGGVGITASNWTVDYAFASNKVGNSNLMSLSYSF